MDTQPIGNAGAKGRLAAAGYVAVAALSGETKHARREDFARWVAGEYDHERSKNGLEKVGFHAAWLMFDAVAEYERRMTCSTFCHPDEPCTVTEDGACEVRRSQAT